MIQRRRHPRSRPGIHVRRRAARVALVALVALGALVASGCGLFTDDAPPPTMAPPPETDIGYGAAGPCPQGDPDCAGNQLLDIYRSTSDDPGPRPVLVWVHGGGFVAGDKWPVNDYLSPFLDDGWDIVSVSYRLTTESGRNEFPVAIADVKQAIRWIRANAEENNWDPSAVAAMGESAGGNIVGFLAATDGRPEFENGDLPPELAAQSSSIAAGVALHPVLDLGMWAENAMWTELVNRYVGCVNNCAVAYTVGSATPRIDPSVAPLMAVFGAQDPVAPPGQAPLLAQAFDQAGVSDRLELVIVDDGPERWQGHESDFKRLAPDMVEFLNSHTGRT